MSEFQNKSDDEMMMMYPEGYFLYELEDQNEVLDFIQTIIDNVIERAIPDPKRVLSLKKAGQCLSLLGKIWNLTECHEGCEIDSIKCPTSDEKLLDMEGYIEEYQFLNLEVVNMALTNIDVIPEYFIWLISVDVSGNSLTNISAKPLTKLPNLVSIKINRNRIEDPYLEPIKHLQCLHMNSNKINSLHRIYHPNLEILDLNWNLISNIDPLDCWKLKKLKQLELRGNKLSTTGGIHYRNLVALFLAENKISKIEGLEMLPNLKFLHMRKNPLCDLTGFKLQNSNLEYLNVRSCEIPNIDEFKLLQNLNGLRVLVMTDNPFNRLLNEDDNPQIVDDDNTRIQILMMLPQLTRINKWDISKEERKDLQNTQEHEEI